MVKKTKSNKIKGADRKAPLIFLTTFGSKQSAFAFSHRLIAEDYAACVNIIDTMTSIYCWKGKTIEEKEILLIGKTTESRFLKLKKNLHNLHPYEVPELISFNISDGNPEYLKWLLNF